MKLGNDINNIKSYLEETESERKLINTKILMKGKEEQIQNINLFNKKRKYNHYSIFLVQVKDTKTEAIKYLKDQRLEYISMLDTMFKNFIESYELIDLITTTLTNWVIATNYKEVEV